MQTTFTADKIAENFDKIEGYLLSVLPHGSGIDCKWEFDYLKNGNVLAKNSFHCMNDNGYYCGYADFTLIFYPTLSLTAFKLQFNGGQAQNLNKRFMLREYLDDVIYQELPRLESPFTIAIKEAL